MTETGGAHVLIVDDDPTVSDVVRRYLEQDGFRVTLAADGMAGLDRFRRTNPDLVVLDLMLPRLPGIEVCRTLRMETDVPIIMLTALGEESDRISGLQMGADDYLAKPFSPRELVLRVRSVLRRATTARQPEPPGVLDDAGVRVDAASRVATRDGEPLNLTVREFDLLLFLMRHPGQAFSRQQLLERVWGWNFGDQSTVTVHVRRLREKVEAEPAAPARIVTVWGVGYRYEATDE